jgi:hypothetical protein
MPFPKAGFGNSIQTIEVTSEFGTRAKSVSSVKEAQPVRRKRGMGRRSKPWAKPLGFGRQIEKVQSFLDLNQKSPVER